MQHSRMRAAMVFFIICSLMAVSSFAQTSKGIIAGGITDNSGAVVTGATVTAVSKDTGETRSVQTGPTGAYRIEAVNPGTYKITVSQQGFATLTIDNVAVTASVITPVDGKLQIGGTETAVTVEAQTNEVQTENGELSHSLSSKEITELPVGSLNPIQLVLTEPGVTDGGGRGISNGFNFSVNGNRPRSNNFLIDGQDNNDNSIQGQALQPNNVNAVQEVTILTNSYSAEFGRGGGSVTNLTYKSGTNNFHGSAWEQYQGSGLNAVQAEDGLGGVTSDTKTRFDQHTYGFTFGGPAIKDKLFFFGSSQWQRFYGRALPATILAPTTAGAAVLQGLANDPNTPSANAALLLRYFGGLRGDPANGGQTVALGNGRPDVQFGLIQRTPPPQQAPDTQWDFKVDYLARQSDTFSVRYLHDRTSLTPDFFNFPASLPGLDTQQGGPSENLGTTWTHIFNPRVVNEFRASYGHFDFTFAPTAETLANPLFQLPTITIQGISSKFPLLGVNSGIPQGRGHATYQFQDALTITRGTHIWKMGADVARLLVKDAIPFNARGTLSYAGAAAAGFNGLGNFVDDFTGIGGTAQRAFGNPLIRPKMFQEAFFLQDTWKIRDNFTLDYGIRYEFQNNPENQLGFPALDLNNPFTNPTVPVRVREDGNNWAPRVGFAYTPHFLKSVFGGDKTVIRGGYGVFYDSFYTNIIDNAASTSPNAIVGLLQGTTDRGLKNSSTLVGTLQPVLNPLSSVTTVDSNLRNPMIHQWNANIERELPLKLLATVAYVGTRGERLYASDQLNPFGGLTATGGTPPTRIQADRGSVQIRDNGGDSIYHGLNVKVDRKVGSGLLIRGAYTYGKLIDDVSEIFALGDTGDRFAQNLDPRTRRLERGLSAYDIRQRFVLAYVWQVPGLKSGSNGLVNALGFATRGWEWSGTTTFQAGSPSTFQIDGIDTNGDGDSLNNRPFLGNPSAPLTTFAVDGLFVSKIKDQQGNVICTPVAGSLYLNGVCSATPISADQVHFLIKPGNGNVGRNTYIGPGSAIFDMAVTRSIRIPKLEGHNVQFRAEMYNVFNHPNLNNPNSPVDTAVNDGAAFLNTQDARFGGRKIYLQLKYQF